MSLLHTAIYSRRLCLMLLARPQMCNLQVVGLIPFENPLEVRQSGRRAIESIDF